MHKIFFFAFIPLIMILSLFLFFSKKNQDSTWKNVRVLAVESSIDEEKVLTLLASKKIEHVISFSTTRYNPFDRQNPFSKEILYAPVQPLYFEYQKKLDSYFFDQTGNFRLYYIKNERLLEKKITAAFTDFSGKYFFENSTTSRFFEKILFVIFLLFYLFQAKHKLFFIFASIPFVFTFIFFPEFMLCIASIFFINSFIIFLQYINKYHYIAALKKDKQIMLFLLFSLLTALAGGVTIFLIFLCCIIILLSGLFLYTLLKKQNQKKYFFIPLSITGVQTVHLAKNFYLKYSRYTLFFVIFFSILFALNTSTIDNAHSITQVAIPKPSFHEKINDFSRFSELYEQSQPSMINSILIISTYWQMNVFPFVSIHNPNKNISFGEQIFYTQYQKEDNSTITKTENLVLTFDEIFIQTLFKKIKNFPLSIEKMILSNESFFTVSYAVSQRKTRNLSFSNIHLYNFLLSLSLGLIAFLVNSTHLTSFFLKNKFRK
ncbi:MAG: hypothetical protein ACRC5H_05790 [Treponemataceae bacterium]